MVTNIMFVHIRGFLFWDHRKCLAAAKSSLKLSKCLAWPLTHCCAILSWLWTCLVKKLVSRRLQCFFIAKEDMFNSSVSSMEICWEANVWIAKSCRG